MVVLENLPPQNANGADVATVNVQYMGNSSDYFNDPRVPEVADSDYRKTPVSLLGARQAINLARYAGAEREAPEELQAAQAQLTEAENAWRLKQSEAETDAISRNAISLGAKAEELAETRRAAKQRREEISRRDAAVREAEQTAATAGQEITDLRSALEREQHARELAERDAANATQQLRDLRTEVARLRDELDTVRAEGEDARVKLARIEGERQALAAREAEAQRLTQLRASASTLKENLSRFGTVRETARGLVLLLPEAVWANARAAELAPAASARLEPLGALLANNPDYQIIIQSYTDNRGDEAALQQLTHERAQVLAQQFTAAGVDSARIQASGMGVANPVASNTKASGRLRNRRTEIVLTLTSAQNTAINQ
jgi:outer membrane protein OmpA-like peptidoglycan-associated protein